MNDYFVYFYLNENEKLINVVCFDEDHDHPYSWLPGTGMNL